nr:unnamed protein product [Callosobruchus chinensis]CAH7761723.1 unnamed protein product [Callosobruchus chinensis]
MQSREGQFDSPVTRP